MDLYGDDCKSMQLSDFQPHTKKNDKYCKVYIFYCFYSNIFLDMQIGRRASLHKNSFFSSRFKSTRKIVLKRKNSMHETIDRQQHVNGQK